MLTEKQINKFRPILMDFISGNFNEFWLAVRKLTKLELVLLLTVTHEIMIIGKRKKVELEDKIIYALSNKP